MCLFYALPTLLSIQLKFSLTYFITAEFIQVGWGKKETQFHGSEGKSAATKKTEVYRHPNKL